MPKPHLKTALAVVAVSCLLLDPASAKYMKAMKVTADSNPFGGPVIEVESDGTKWTRIKPESHQIKVRVDIRSGAGWRISDAFIGVPDADFAGTGHDPDAIRHLGGGRKTKSITRDEVHAFHTDDLVLDRQAIIDACNSSGQNATQEQTLFNSINVGIKAFFQKRRDVDKLREANEPSKGRSETAYARAPVTIHCQAGPSHIDAPPKPVSVDIRVKQKGDTCPKDTEVTAYIDYEKPMTARFRVIHNGVEPKSDPIMIKARKVSLAGKTWYRVERLERYKLDPGQHIFQIKVFGLKKSDDKLSPKKTVTIGCPPFKVTSAWLSYKVEDKQVCKKRVDEEAVFYTNRPGDIPYRIKTQGGLVVTHGIAYASREGDKYVARRPRTLSMGAFDQMMSLEVLNDHNVGDQKPLKVDCLDVQSGTLDLRSFAPSTCQGVAAFSIRASMPGDVPYRLDCTGGRSWHGTLQVHKTGPGTYIGVGTERFDVGNNDQVNCALKTRAPLPVQVLALKGHKYVCHKRAVEPATKDLTVKPRPAARETHPKADKVKTDQKAKAKNAKKAEKADAAAKRKAAAERRKRARAEKAAGAHRKRPRHAGQSAVVR